MIKDLLMNKKTLVGAVVMFVLYGLNGIGLLDEQTFKTLANFGEIILGVGLAHKAYKQVN